MVGDTSHGRLMAYNFHHVFENRYARVSETKCQDFLYRRRVSGRLTDPRRNVACQWLNLNECGGARMTGQAASCLIWRRTKDLDFDARASSLS